MKDREFNEKFMACVLGKEELFNEVVDELAGRIKEEFVEYDYNYERDEENCDDESCSEKD